MLKIKKIASAKQLGILVKTTRQSNQLTQKELAGVCGTGVRFIQDLERGKPTCELGKALNVLKMLGIIIKVSHGE